MKPETSRIAMKILSVIALMIMPFVFVVSLIKKNRILRNISLVLVIMQAIYVGIVYYVSKSFGTSEPIEAPNNE